MPALAILLSLETGGAGDMVAFVSGLLLGSDQAVRNWFAIFIRNGQKVSKNIFLIKCKFDELHFTFFFLF